MPPAASTVTITFGDPGGATGFEVDASTSVTFTGALTSSITFDTSLTTLTISGLSPNTSYYFQAGAYSGGTTNYANTNPPAVMTLALPLSGAQVLQSTTNAITVGWAAAPVGAAAGYKLDVSTVPAFNAAIVSSSTVGVQPSTLTVGGLLPSTTYFVRVAAINGAGMPNFVLVGSTQTVTGGGGGPPINPTPAGPPGVSSITMNWGNPGGTNGFVVNASTTSNFSGTVLSSATINPAQLSLSVQGLAANTTYFMQVGALYGGATTYSTQVSTISTLASLLVNVAIYQVNPGSITVNWSAFGVGPGINTSEGYMLQASSAPNFATVLFASSNTTAAVSTLTLVGLAPSTTYYLRAGAINWMSAPAFVAIGSVTTPAGSGGLPAPTGLVGSATVPALLNWNWNLVGGATGYNIYLASSPATLLAGTTTNSWLEPAPQTNSPYGIVVAAVGGGQQSPLSASATTYTQANQPPIPGVSNVGSSSFTVTWGTAGNPGNTPYQVELALNNALVWAPPHPFLSRLILRAVPRPSSAWRRTPAYWVRVTARNVDGVSTPGQFISQTTKPNGSGTGAGSGLGTATLVPSSVPEGGVVTATVTFTVPAVGMSVGGRLEIDAPTNWWPNILQNINSTQDGFVTATSTAGIPFNLTFGNTSPVVTISFSSGTLTAGTTIQVVFNNIHPNCPVPNQTQMHMAIKSAMGPADPLRDIVNQSSQTLATGQFQWIGYNPWNPLTAVVNQPSQAIVLQADDNCGQPVVLAAPITVNLQALKPDGTSDSGATFSAVSNMTPSTTSVVITAGTSTATYYYQTPTFGNNLQIRGDYLSPFGNQQVWRSVNVLPNALTFSNVSVDNGVPVAGQKSLTMSPDGSGVNNFAYLRFTPSDNSTQWHVAISSNGFQTLVFSNVGGAEILKGP